MVRPFRQNGRFSDFSLDYESCKASSARIKHYYHRCCVFHSISNQQPLVNSWSESDITGMSMTAWLTVGNALKYSKIHYHPIYLYHYKTHDQKDLEKKVISIELSETREIEDVFIWKPHAIAIRIAFVWKNIAEHRVEFVSIDVCIII